MIGVGDILPEFHVIGVRPGFNAPVEDSESAFEDITNASFPEKWKVIFFYPKDFTFVCPTEIIAFASLSKHFEQRDAVLLGGSSDNEYSKLGWRREHADLSRLPIYQFADNGACFARSLGVLDITENVALRATLIVDPNNMVQHISVNGLNVGRSPEETLRVLDAIQTDELCACNRPIGG